MVASRGIAPGSVGSPPSRLGYAASGQRIFKRARGRTKSEAQRKLKEIIREYEDGLVIGGHGYTVADAVRDWLAFGLSGRDSNTVTKCTILANTHIIPALGARKLRDLSAEDIDKWLADKAQIDRVPGRCRKSDPS